MTNREAHEEAAGMGLDDMFFRFNKIDPDALMRIDVEFAIEQMQREYDDDTAPRHFNQGQRYGIEIGYRAALADVGFWDGRDSEGE
jgi:hypothetical protein